MSSGQIDLFTRRVRKPPSPKEVRLHIALADALRVSMSQGWSYTHLPFGELRDKATAALLQRMGVTRGWPDFMFVGTGFAFIELKRKGERPTPEQMVRGHELTRAGAMWLATDDVADAIGWLKDLGIIRARVSA